MQADADPSVPELYEREAQILCTLAHPNIVRGYGVIFDYASQPVRPMGLLVEKLDGDLGSLLAPERRLVMLAPGHLCKTCAPQQDVYFQSAQKQATSFCHWLETSAAHTHSASNKALPCSATVSAAS